MSYKMLLLVFVIRSYPFDRNIEQHDRDAAADKVAL